MRPISRLVSTIVSVLCLATSATAAEPPCQSVKLDSRGGPQHIELVSNKPFVQVRFNGSRPLHFVLDAGSPFTLLNTGIPQTIGFSVASETTLANGFVARTYTPKACVSVLGVTLSDIGIGDIELDHVSAVEGTRVDGLIGGELFTKYVVRIDYMAGAIDVFPASYEYHGDGTVLPLTIDGLAFTDASVQAPDGHYVKGRFIVDTGVRMALLFNAPFVEQNGLLTGQKRVPRVTVGVGVNGETTGDVFQVRDAEIGGLHLPNVVAVVSRDGVVIDPNSGLAGIIGGDFLQRFRLTLDYPHHQMILEETPQTYRPFNYDRSGMFLLAEGDDLRTIRVHRVFTGSPAEDAGIHAGDRIVSIDGRAARRLGLEETRRLLREDNTRYRVRLERAGKLVDTQLVTCDLLRTRAATS